MLNSKWLLSLFIAWRYLKGRQKSRGLTSSLISLLGITFGVLVLITVISVMNGFQLNYISNLLEVSSYHLQIIPKQNEELSLSDLSRLKADPQVKALVPFREFQVIVDRLDEWSETNFGILRAIDLEAAGKDEDFILHLFKQEKKQVDLKRYQDILLSLQRGEILVGNLFAQYLGLKEKSEIIVSTIDELIAKIADNEDGYNQGKIFKIKTIFESGFRDIDQNYIFIDLKDSNLLLSSEEQKKDFKLCYGLKLKDRFQDLVVKERLSQILNNELFEIRTWRDYNRGYFKALYTEKTVMAMLISLILLVVAFHIYYSLRRLVTEKTEDIALLKAIGASPLTVRSIFILEGLLLGLGGGLLGCWLGFFLTTNISGLFNFLADLINGVFRLFEYILGGLGFDLDLGIFESPFSPRIFYFKEVPNVIILEEVWAIFLFAFFSATLAAFVASRKVSIIKPNEVIRNE